jgi:hypothetical protein
VTVSAAGKPVEASLTVDGRRLGISLAAETVIEKGQTLRLTLA